MPRAICEDCGSLVEAELTHNGICAVGHYVHCGWGHELSPDDLISDDAAQIIEALEDKLAKAEGALSICSASWGECNRILDENKAKLAKAEAGLLAIAKRDEQMIWGEDYEVEEAFKDMRDIALATLAAVTETHKIKSSKAAPPYGLEGESHE